MQRSTRNTIARFGVAAAFVVSTAATAQIPLGTAASFGVLGGATVTNTGPTIVNANLGVSPGSAVTGFPPGVVANGTIHQANAVAGQAQTDLTTAYNAIAGTACNVNLTGQDLGGLTLTPGVYCFDTSAQLTGALTLNALNNPNALFLFKIGSTLTTASASSVTIINGSACNKAFWQVGSSATLGTGSTFAGDILALSSITLTTSASTSGRLLARNGAVALDSNNVNSCAVAVAPPTLTTVASPNIVLGGGTLTDSATVTGRANPVGASTITFRLYGPNDTNCTNAAVFAPPPVAYPIAGGPISSPPFTPTLAGTYRWIASYSGDGANPPVAGLCNDVNESTIVAPPGPTLATMASPNIVLGAGNLSDSATVSGRTNPIGASTITFRLYGPNDANCTNAPVFAPAAVNYPIAGGPVNSPAFTPTLAGTYRWIATYGGDGNNPPVAGLCNDINESTIVAPPGPQIITLASPTIVLGAGTLTDSATVNGRVNPIGPSTITFRLYGPNDANCTSPAVFVSGPVTYPIAGGPVISPPFTPTLAGTYRWIAAYSGDGTNPPVSGVCNDVNENVVVSPQPLRAVTTITSQASPIIRLGAGVLTDTAIVSGRVNPVAGATVTFRLYGPGDATCTGAPVFTSTVDQPVANGPVTSAAFTPTQVGTYRWIATYNGDANNLPIAGLCNAANENVDVAAAAAAPATAIPTLGHLALLLLILGVMATVIFGRKRTR